MKPETSIPRLADCPAGKIPYLEGELRDRFRDWLTEHGPLAVISDNEVRLVNHPARRQRTDGASRFAGSLPCGSPDSDSNAPSP